MGMSASQARYLSLVARQNDLEYQGQQINQERTVLSQQCTALYNSLLTLDVPTPPSTTDYQVVTYSATSGATTYTFDASSVKPGSNGLYALTLGLSAYGSSITENNTTATVTNGASSINGCSFTISEDNDNSETVMVLDNDNINNSMYQMYAVTYSDIKNYSGDEALETWYYNAGNNEVKEGKIDDENLTNNTVCYVSYNDYMKIFPEADDTTLASKIVGISEYTYSTNSNSTIDDVTNLYVVETNGKIRKANSPSDYFEQDGTYHLYSNKTYFLANATKDSISKQGYTSVNDGNFSMANAAMYTVGGCACYTLDDAVSAGIITQDVADSYASAIDNAGLSNSSRTEPYTADDFYVYQDSSGNIKFVLKNECSTAAQNTTSNTVRTFSYIANGSYTQNISYDNVILEFDPSTGRITTMSLPTYDSNNNIIGYTEISVTASTDTDEAAYQDAYAQYEYQQYLYDKEQQAINAKTEVIQQEDKNLEMKLTRLDNERTAITTEIDAVKKVIEDNIDSSYKTFSG